MSNLNFEGQQSHSSPLENFTAAPWLSDEMANVQNFQPGTVNLGNIIIRDTWSHTWCHL